MKLQGCSAVVTGGASGLGEATARALSAHGVRVAIFDLKEEWGLRLAADLGATFCRVDVTDDASVDAGFAAARVAQGQERILVNCAGTFRCIAKSAAGTLAMDSLEDGERGVIVNTASIAAEDGQIGQAAYSASKAGIVGLTLPVARDLMNDGIRVNTIMPGIFDTPLMQGVPPNVRQALADGVPFPKRLGAAGEYASIVLEICRNRYFNGAALRLDGALRMGPR